MKRLFWKTYRVKFTTVDRSMNKYEFYRGFTWQVVIMAAENAKKISEKENKIFSVEEITRIY